MRILMVIESGFDKNPYVSSLVAGLTRFGHEVVCSLPHFWDCFEKYDLLYFQWPEAVFNWGKDEIDIDKKKEEMLKNLQILSKKLMFYSFD